MVTTRGFIVRADAAFLDELGVGGPPLAGLAASEARAQASDVEGRSPLAVASSALMPHFLMCLE